LINTVLNSTKHLIGLSPTTPIFVTIDQFRFQEFANLLKSLEEKIDALDEYTEKLWMNTLKSYSSNICLILPALSIYMSADRLWRAGLTGRRTVPFI
jgi:hypothetical protein